MKAYAALLAVAVTIPIACSGPPPPVPSVADDYVSTVEAWRARREERLRSPDGWTSLVGLHWLEPGENSFGSDPSCAVVLEGPGVPAHAGSFLLEGDIVRVVAPEDGGLTLRGEPVRERVLHPDTSGKPDVLRLGRLSFYVIRRGERFAIRVKDPESPARIGFHGLRWYPVDPAWRIEARWEPYDEPRLVQIPTVLGTVEPMFAPGLARFEVNGRELTLEPALETPDATQLFFIFRDATSADTTYGAGRFLYSELPSDDHVVLDFNEAYNPPCAFTPYATCPLPPGRNVLPIRIEAGEKRYGDH